MRIILLNFPVDNNYGGMLQRYALVSVLQKMGHEVTHLNLRFEYNKGNCWYKLKRDIKRIIKKIVFFQNKPVFVEYVAQKSYEKSCLNDFYYKYIPHTKRIYQHSEIEKYCRNSDALIVGSDQVWRRSMSGPFPYSTMFFDFAKTRTDVKRIAYGVSFGRNYDELSQEDLEIVTPLYMLFDAVSVRENFNKGLLTKYSWSNPSPKLVLDPTLLLTRDDYVNIIQKVKTKPATNSVFCYVLDKTQEKQKKIDSIVYEKQLTPIYCDLNLLGKNRVEQFLRSFLDTEMVVTDSYHGIVFSIIFNKPFYFLRNERRGNERYDSLISLLDIDENYLDWNKINNRIAELKKESLSFLLESLQ